MLTPGDKEEISARLVPKMRWECIRCGSCCMNIGIKEWFDESLKDDLDLLGDDGCRFLGFKDGKSFCKEYEKRPGACRRYPFLISIDGDIHYLSIHKKCKGISKGYAVDIRMEFQRVLELVEEDLGIQYMIEDNGEDENSFKLHRIN